MRANGYQTNDALNIDEKGSGMAQKRRWDAIEDRTILYFNDD
jgi:hypothetical protein